MTRVLAVINHWPSADNVVAKASSLARALHGDVLVYCPVSSQVEEMNKYIGFDNYEAVRDQLLAESKTRLDEVAGIDELESDVEWQPRLYKGVADKAEAVSAAMIVMSVSEHSVVGDFLHKPDDWHLLRDAPCPVLILSTQGKAYREVAVALDPMEDSENHHALNARLLDQGQMMAEALHLPLHVITVVPDPSYIYADISATDTVVMTDFRDQAEAMTREHQHQLLNRLGVRAHRASVITGRVERHLQEVLDNAGLLVIGTIANKGLKGFFLGNTSERLLQHLSGDMLVVN